MTTKFRILFTVSIAHAYYASGCEDFEFIIPADTARALNNGRMLAKMREGKLFILVEADEANAPLVSFAGRKLRFGLKLLNPAFSNFTSMGFDSGIFKGLYRNATVPDTLNVAAGVRLIGPVFHHELTAPNRPVTVTLKNQDNQTLRTETVTVENDRPSVSFDITGQAAGACALEEVYAGGTETMAYYCDAELVPAAIFGIIEIQIDGSFYTTPPEFTVPFAAKEETLKYYVVAKNYTNADFNLISVTDTGFTEDGRPQLQFDKVTAGAFTPDEIPLAMLNEGSAQVVLFKSQTTVTRKDRARRKIQLNKNGAVLITHLPQPGESKTNANLIIHISKP